MGECVEDDREGARTNMCIISSSLDTSRDSPWSKTWPSKSSWGESQRQKVVSWSLCQTTRHWHKDPHSWHWSQNLINTSPYMLKGQ